jgi:hypothetical protein
MKHKKPTDRSAILGSTFLPFWYRKGQVGAVGKWLPADARSEISGFPDKNRL